MKIVAFLVVIILIALVMLIPPVSDVVAKPFKTTGQFVRNVAANVVGIGVGLLLVAFGVMAIATVPVIGVMLIVAGLSMALYTAWPLIYKPSKPINSITG